MKKLIGLLVAGAVLAAGCTGSFNLTRTVNDLHRSQDDKWVDEIIFLGVVIVPIYGIAMLGDAIVFNSIEFWTGDNPVKKASLKAPGEPRVYADVSYKEASDSIDLVGVNATGEPIAFIIERGDNGVEVKNADGLTLYTSTKNPDGSVTVYAQDEAQIRTFPAEQVQLTHANLN